MNRNNNLRAKMISDIDQYRRRSKDEGLYFMLASDEMYRLFSDPSKDANKLYSLFEMYKDWDDYGSLPLEVGMLYEELLADKSHVVGIHRSDSIGQFGDVQEDHILIDVFTNGLRNNGDLASSGLYNSGYIDPSKTLTPCHNILNLVILSKTPRKQGDKASIIVSIPKQYVDESLDIVNNQGSNIYVVDSNGNRNIKPDFIVGCIYQDNGNCTFYVKDDIIKEKQHISK